MKKSGCDPKKESSYFRYHENKSNEYCGDELIEVCRAEEKFYISSPWFGVIARISGQFMLNIL